MRRPLLTGLNIAITDAAAMDGYIGAQINTLNSISQVMSTQKERRSVGAECHSGYRLRLGYFEHVEV